jgi:hypothetical protein
VQNTNTKDPFTRFVKALRKNDFTTFSKDINKTMTEAVKKQTAQITKKK